MPSPSLPSSLPQIDFVSASPIPSEHFVYTNLNTSHIFFLMTWLRIKTKRGIFLCPLAVGTQLFFQWNLNKYSLVYLIPLFDCGMVWSERTFFQSFPGRTCDTKALIWLVSLVQYFALDWISKFCIGQDLHFTKQTKAH